MACPVSRTLAVPLKIHKVFRATCRKEEFQEARQGLKNALKPKLSGINCQKDFFWTKG